MSHNKNSLRPGLPVINSSSSDRINLYRRKALTMAFRASKLFTAFEFEDDYLRAAPVFDDRAGDARAVNDGRADADAVVIARYEDFVEFDGVTLVFASQSRDADDITWTYSVLFPAGADDCVCHY
jgi:hypothetical protein